MAPHKNVEAGRGWRVVLLLVHLVSMLVVAWALWTTVYQRTHVKPSYFRGALVYDWGVEPEQYFEIMFMDQWGTFGQLSLLAVGILMTPLIVRGDKRVPRYYLWYGVALLAFEAVLGRTQHQLWDVARGTTETTYASYVTMCAAAMAAWAVCVSRSSRVRAAFVQDPRTIGPKARLLIGWGALALIAWPFLLNLLVNATIRLAGYISAQGTTAGEGFAEGIMAASAATGLLLLLKHSWQMRTKWIAVLLPVGFAVLAVLYQMQSFMLHWTF